MPGMTSFGERHTAKNRGDLSCFDRVVITGTLPDVCHADAMARYLSGHGVRQFDYPRWAEPFRDELRAHAERLAKEHGLAIDFIQRKDFRKEERVKAILAQRGHQPGLVHIFSAMEPCASFRPWHDRAGPLLPASPDVGALPAAVLLQRHTHQASLGPGGDQALRQIRAHRPRGVHGQIPSW